MRICTFILAATLTSLAFPGNSGSVSDSRCLNGLVPALAAGHFSGSLDCRRDRLSVHFVGQIKAAGHTFSIYNYEYKLHPPCPECAAHGGQRIIIMQDGIYLGQYKTDLVRVAVHGADLVITPSGDLETFGSCSSNTVAIPFGKGGPPPSFWVAGEVLNFFQ